MTTDAGAVEYPPISATREELGREIAKAGGIRQLGARYVVPSQPAHPDAPVYLVDVVEQTCTCADYELNLEPCKHYEACMFWLAWQGDMNADTGEVVPPKKHRTYKQNVRAYDAIQTLEREQVQHLLHSLCEIIEDPTRAPGRPGRKPIPRREATYAALTKIFSLCSGRQAETDIKAAFDRGHLSRVWDHNTICRVLEDSALTDVLVRLIDASAAPLAAIEGVRGQYAADPTGLSTATCTRWFDIKQRKAAYEYPFVRLQFICGTATHVIAGATVSHTVNCRGLPELVSAADRHYDRWDNLEATVEASDEPFIPFNTNSQGITSSSPYWRKMWAHFSLKAEDFFDRYRHQASAAAVVSMIKRNFGGAVRSKLPVAQANEVLCKCVLHNLTRIVHVVGEFGIDVDR